jgi:aryl-phospho-beta-D-glucosidase BglC (GH1 family)
MWAYIANRYKDRKAVAGFDLMVEPNPAGELLQIDEPEDFYRKYKGSLYDWHGETVLNILTAA